jgi:hypothetical protein
LGFDDPEEQTAYYRLNNAKPRGFDQALAALKPGFSRFQLALLGYQLGWLKDAAGIRTLIETLRSAWPRPSSSPDRETRDYLCQVRASLPPEADAWSRALRCSH